MNSYLYENMGKILPTLVCFEQVSGGQFFPNKVVVVFIFSSSSIAATLGSSAKREAVPSFPHSKKMRQQLSGVTRQVAVVGRHRV